MELHELFEIHKSLRKIDVNPVAVEQERAVVAEMRRRGFQPRFVDDLAKAAGTEPEGELPPPTVEEVLAYTRKSSVGVLPNAVSIAKPLDGDTLHLSITSPALRSAASSILKAVERQLPPGIKLGLDENLKDDGFVQARALYALQLVPAAEQRSIITTARAIVTGFREEAASVCKVFKAGEDPRVPFRVMKRAQAEQIVTGVVLEPNTPDGTRTDESDADIYSDAVIQKAMYFWVENKGAPFSYHHVDHGGKRLSPEDVILLENWQARSDYIEGDQQVFKGSWMMTTRVRHPQLWSDIDAGRINSWSIGMRGLAGFEEAVL
jgi:hypothetical protein